MPNLLANREVFPEFIQRDANAQNLAREANIFIDDSGKREGTLADLDKIAASLGGEGAANRASKAVWKLMDQAIEV